MVIGGKMIYFDNAATTLHKPQEVIEAVKKAMSSMGMLAEEILLLLWKLLIQFLILEKTLLNFLI